MKAVILAAVRGSRLGALTQDRPKTLFPIQGHMLLSGIQGYPRGAMFPGGDLLLWQKSGENAYSNNVVKFLLFYMPNGSKFKK
ncbi:hypothetical protein OBV_13390 [Oscillibacter valericigenes Sjm18-20]|nr:hypothetical protein OBV_13390 [Oscillibacter valericigenes Sjm18-20]